MFVPDRGRQLHVLMPPTHVHHGHPGSDQESDEHTTEPHEAWLVWDKAYEDPRSTDFAGELIGERLEGMALDLSHLAGGIDTELWPEIVNVYPAVGEKLKRSRVSNRPRGRVLSRVTMSAGQIDWVDPGHQWLWISHPPRSAAWVVKWTIPLAEPWLKWELKYLDVGGTMRLPTLAPPGNLLEIDVGVFHVPRRHVPGKDLSPPDLAEPPLDPYAPAEHFEAFYNLFDAPVHRPVPMYSHKGEEGDQTTAAARSALARRSGSRGLEASERAAAHSARALAKLVIGNPYSCVGCGGMLE